MGSEPVGLGEAGTRGVVYLREWIALFEAVIIL